MLHAVRTGIKRFLSPAVILVFALGVALAGCSDNEPKERAAFIDFLNKQVLNTERVSGADLTEDQKKETGRYAAHYDLVRTFFSEVYDREQQVDKKSITPSTDYAKALKEKDTFKKAAAELKGLAESIKASLAKAEAAKKNLKQPEDLQAVFDKVFEKEVVRYAKAKIAYYEASEALFQQLVVAADFLEKHKDTFEIQSNSLMMVKEDPAAEKELEAMQQKIEETISTLNKAGDEVRKVL